MSLPSLSCIRGIIWDLDGTLYRYDKIFVEACNVAAARTAIDLGLQMSFEAALGMAVQSEKLHGNSFKLFESYGIRYEDFHGPFHAAVDLTIIRKNLDMKLALEALKIPMVILTNASREWARKTINHLEYGHLFGDGTILALEDSGYQSKCQGTKGLEKSLVMLGVCAEEVLMVEDLPKNLLHAKSMGMTTALVHHGQLPDRDLDHIDFFFEDTLELVRSIRKNSL